MSFDFNLKSAILLVFFIHAVVFTVLLLVKALQSNQRPSVWLSVFTLLCGLYIAPFMCGYAGWYALPPYRHFLFYIPFQQLFFIPPVLYFYIKTHLDKSFVFTKIDLLHFVLGTGYLSYTIFIYLSDSWLWHEGSFYADGKDKDFSAWYQIAGFISLIVYTGLSLKYYAIYKRTAYQSVSFADAILFRWIKRFLIALLLLLTLRVLFFVINPEWAQFGRKFWYYLCFSILFYYISISGYVHSFQTVNAFPYRLGFDEAERKTLSIEENNPTEIKSPVYLNTGDVEMLKIKIEQLMDKSQVFKNPVLTLNDVAALLEINPKRVSQAINQGFEMNFNDFVNHYRTLAVIREMESGRPNLHTLLGIAYDCGFNSKSTFNRAFKKQTNLTPRDYLAGLTAGK